jgi:CubicO group peptidase (beta-lactamase class C family)
VAIAADDDGYTVELSEDCAPDGRFEIGSPTKTMTGLVLASLVDDGIVAFDDEIDRWLDAGDNANITLRQLATHTSGSPGHTGGAPDPCAFLTAEVAEYELRKSPTRPRGVEWDYSNFGFQVLSLVLERAHSRANEQDRLPSHHGGSA